MDEIDIAQKLDLDFAARAIEANRRPTHPLRPRNLCYNCDDPVEGDKLFCDDHCRIDWQTRIKRINSYEVFQGAR